jgi:hypothetical protein
MLAQNPTKNIDQPMSYASCIPTPTKKNYSLCFTIKPWFMHKLRAKIKPWFRPLGQSDRHKAPNFDFSATPNFDFSAAPNLAFRQLPILVKKRIVVQSRSLFLIPH